MRRATTCSSAAGAASITRWSRAGLRDAPRLARERQHAQRDLGGQVLVGDRDLAALPEVADEPERRGDDLVVDGRHAEARLQRLADDELGRYLVAGQQRRGVRAAELASFASASRSHGEAHGPFRSRFPRPVGHCRCFAFERGTR